MKRRLFFVLIICLLTSLNTLAQNNAFIVDAKQEWQATGVTINSGEGFSITGKGTYADGTGGMLGNPNAWASPDGRSNQDFSGATGLLAPNFPFAALIGKIGSNGVPFGIGSYLFKTATTSGELYLSVNDVGGTFYDNYGYLVAIISSSTVTIPVELTAFTANVSGNNVLLEWITVTEVNNYGFEIERKTSTDWIKIGFAEGQGTSTSLKSYSFTDKKPFGGSRFKYRLKQIDMDGKYKYSEIVEVEILPKEYALFQNYPNPFNPNTTIRYSISSPEIVSIKISDASGQLVKEINKEHSQAGKFEVIWDGTNNLGERVSSGAYFYQLSVNNHNEAKKMILLK